MFRVNSLPLAADQTSTKVANTPLLAAGLFISAFGIPAGPLYSRCAGLIVAGVAILCGRFALGDLLPLYNRGKGVEPLAPLSPWTMWCAALLAAIPAVPLLLCGLLIGALRLSPFRSLAVFSAGFVVRILIPVVAG